MKREKLKNSKRKTHPASQARVPAGMNKAKAKIVKKPAIWITSDFRLICTESSIPKDFKYQK